MTQVDLRKQTPAIRDQGQRPTCLAFAFSDGHAVIRGDTDPLSVDYLHYHAARRLGVGMNTGVSRSMVVAALRDDGQPSETSCPYDENRPDAWVAPSNLSPLWHRSTTVQKGRASEVIEASLLLNKPNVLTLRITPAFFVPDPAGRIVDDGANGIVGHAVLVVGVEKVASGKLEFLVRNSWGATWGLEGHAWVAASYIDRNTIEVIDLERGVIS